MAEVPAEYLRSGLTVTLAVDAQLTFLFSSFLFDAARVVHFDATPDAVSSGGIGPFRLQVITDRTERDLGGGVRRVVVFRPRFAVIPAGRFFGGGF